MATKKPKTWQKEWKEIYTSNPTSFTPFYYWLKFAKGWSQARLEELELDSDEGEKHEGIRRRS